MKSPNQQLMLIRAFSSGRDYFNILQEAGPIIDEIAYDRNWQERIIKELRIANKKKNKKNKKEGKGKVGMANPKAGKKGHDIVFIIRLILVQSILRKDYRELAGLLIDSLSLRIFLEIEGVEAKKLPKYQTISDWVRGISKETFEEINQKLIIGEGVEKLEMGLKKWRSDATVVESNIHYPTDSGLLNDGLRWMHRWIERMREELKILSRMDDVKLTFENGHLIYLEILKFKGIGKNQKKARKKSYRKLIKRTEQIMWHFQRHVDKGKKLCLFYGIGFTELEMITSYAKYSEMLEEWERLKPLLEKALEQARLRVLKGKKIASEDKLLSLWEEHSQVIVRGKAGKPCEFGHKVTFWESEEGMMLCGDIYKEGNPNESKVLEKELERLTQKGYVFEHLSLDRGYYDEKKLEEIKEKNGKIIIYCPKKGKKNEEQAKYEKTIEFQKMQRFRVGIEGSISVLIRRHSLRRAMLKKWEGFERHVHMCLIGMNILRLLDYKKNKEFQEQQQQKLVA